MYYLPRFIAVGFATFLLESPNTRADPILLIYEGLFQGSLNGVPFSLTSYRIDVMADTANRHTGGSVWLLPHDTPMHLQIEGVGMVDFLIVVESWVDRTVPGISGRVGLSEFNGSTWYAGPTSEELGLWNMDRSIGPVSYTSTIWGHGPFATTGGPLLLESPVPRPGTFTAILLPEPATATTFVLVALAAAGALRRR